jgi:hypothetical protein
VVSNIKKATIERVSFGANAMSRNVPVATAKTYTPSFSFLIVPMKIENREDPAMQQTMNVAKITPNGISPSVFSFIAGVHMNTKMYMDPSNNDETRPVNRIAFELIVVK